MSGAEMVTWSDPEGGEVCGDYSFVTDVEWFEDDTDPVRLRRQRWVCVEDEVGTYWPTSIQLCDACHGEGELYPPDTNDVAECPTCKGTGEHPLRGAGFVTEAGGGVSRRLTAASVLATFVAVCAGWLDLALVLFIVATLWALCDLVMTEREQVARHARSVR